MYGLYFGLKCGSLIEPGLALAAATMLSMSAIAAYLYRRLNTLMNERPGKTGWY